MPRMLDEYRPVRSEMGHGYPTAGANNLPFLDRIAGAGSIAVDATLVFRLPRRPGSSGGGAEGMRRDGGAASAEPPQGIAAYPINSSAGIPNSRCSARTCVIESGRFPEKNSETRAFPPMSV